MEKQRFIKLIQQPELAGTADNQALKALVRQYPYFQAAHQLLLLVDKDLAPENFEAQLYESSIYVANRSQLFNLVHGIPVPVAPATVAVVEVPEVKTPEVVEAEVEIVKPTESADLLEFEETEGPKTETVVKPIEYSLTEDMPGFVPEFEFELDITDEQEDSVPTPSQFDLIDQFINKVNPISPPKLIATDTLEDISGDSIREDEEIATEMLAKIYTSQKLYDKAIKVYEKLILKFPEKSTYFASRIEELKNNIK